MQSFSIFKMVFINLKIPSFEKRYFISNDSESLENKLKLKKKAEFSKNSKHTLSVRLYLKTLYVAHYIRSTQND